MRWLRRHELEPLDLDAENAVVHAAMMLEGEAMKDLLEPYGDREIPPRRIRRRVDVHEARLRTLHRELVHRDENRRLLMERERFRVALEERLREPAVQPQKWGNLRDAVELIEGMLREDPAARARAEIVTAYVVDVMAGIGLDYRDPSVLYAVLSGAGIVTELASNGHQRGEVDQTTVVAIARIVQTLTAALIPYLPDDVKPNLDVVIPDDLSGLLGPDDET